MIFFFLVPKYMWSVSQWTREVIIMVNTGHNIACLETFFD